MSISELHIPFRSIKINLPSSTWNCRHYSCLVMKQDIEYRNWDLRRGVVFALVQTKSGRESDIYISILYVKKLLNQPSYLCMCQRWPMWGLTTINRLEEDAHRMSYSDDQRMCISGVPKSYVLEIFKKDVIITFRRPEKRTFHGCPMGTSFGR